MGTLDNLFSMFRNQYDTDVTTWSPQGRLHQVEYAMEAVKQGSAAVGCVSATHAVLATRMKVQSDLSDHQRKIFRVDDHIAVAIAGLVADGRVLCKFMRNKCMNYRFVYESGLPVSRLVRDVADKSQGGTQFASRRPYGVGMLVVGCDRAGPHLFHTCPSGNAWEYRAMAIGARAQSAKTYLEKNYESFQTASVDELIKHALFALRETAGTVELTSENVSVCVVGIDSPVTMLSGARIAPHLEAVEAQGPPTAAATVEEEQPAAMEP
eukprot:c5782_g1_i1.p1 GENE.c5782_g1_i1~~c5782_g1_i1.p1  ORF type:complete len:267 (+),score=83.21 c5782_g1_i1:1-801(+)